MIGIGIRVYSNSKVYYALIEKSPDSSLEYIEISHLIVPLALVKPERLNFVRNTILDILVEYKVESAVIRLSEARGALKNYEIERLFLEGVLQEALASCSVNRYCAAQIAQISGILKWDRTDFKKYADNEKSITDFSWDTDWSQLSKEERESVIACLAALEL